MFDRLVHIIDALSDRAGQTSAFFVILLFFIMGYEVAARFIFDLPTFWAYELGYMITGLHYIFGIAYVTKMKQHIRVDFVYAVLPPRAQAGIDWVVLTFFLMPVTIWMTWQLGRVALEAFIVGETSGESAWNPIIWPLRIMVTIGFGFFALQVVAEVIRSFRTMIGRPVPAP
ncbi:MAG: TRAP transporter small permease subunit [Rhodospirillaceae bacterium]|nr:TRAP transporter small permease subunit [Rhodospirillaceae bacterium]MDD9914707.1 TRAP transporter small permease subunit [Rhodospirillaceae bacterium]MDD9928874.1 TRAP transporter small permease subunit [Rhodospirillaceae bacterium]